MNRYFHFFILKMRLKPFLNLLYPSKTLFRYYSQEYVPQAIRSLKGKSTREQVQYYRDSVRVRVVGGNGGDGCISFLHSWCKDMAGPDGGDGGHGGHVIFQASQSVKSLNHIHSVVIAKNGEKGYNKECCGKNAQHIVLQVPVGTIVNDASGRVVGDLSVEGGMYVAARGGAGGRGNKFFLTDVEQGPEIAEFGAQGETNTYTLEVRSMAHIGLIGFPNAGKSTLLRAITRARPKVAPYPFTTLRPHLGMIQYDDYEQVAVADLPGLIPGSHKNHGLGIQFLQHTERCCGLLFILDGSTEDPLSQFEILDYELTKYNSLLAERPKCIIVNKIDLEEGFQAYLDIKKTLCGDGHSDLSNKDGHLSNKDGHLSNKDGDLSENNQNEIICSSNENTVVLGISAKTGKGLSDLLRFIRKMYDKGLKL